VSNTIEQEVVSGLHLYKFTGVECPVLTVVLSKRATRLVYFLPEDGSRAGFRNVMLR